jgi:hypothetical protein
MFPDWGAARASREQLRVRLPAPVPGGGELSGRWWSGGRREGSSRSLTRCGRTPISESLDLMTAAGTWSRAARRATTPAARSAEVRWIASATSLVGGQERHERQQQDVEAHHHAIRTCQAAEDSVVHPPQATDRDEALRVRQVGRPLVRDALPEVVEVTFQDADLDDEQGDRDREDAARRVLSPDRVGVGLAKAQPG